MATFTYDAFDAQGKLQRGSLAADSRAAALDALAGRGLAPVKVEGGESPANGRAPAAATPGWLSGSQRVPAAQVEAFTRELANLLAAGVPLSRGLSILQREATHPAAKMRWAGIHDDVVSGKPLAEALARAGNAFPPVYIAMVRAGELGGFLDLVLNQIADFRWRESELKGRVKSAMVYPVVLAGLAVAVLIFLMIFFIPTFSKIFEDFGAALPLLTRVIVAASRFCTHYGLVIALAAAGSGYGIRRFFLTDRGSRLLERATLKVPGLGVVLARFALVRFARMLGTLLGAGVPLVTALRVAQEALGNQTLADAVGQAILDVKQGATLSRSLASCKELFPPSVIEMIAVAEESGRLDKELNRLAMIYESELDRRLRMLVALAEPALLFVMAALIGTIVVGMLLPIYTLQDMYK